MQPAPGMYPVNVTAASVEGPRSRGLALAGVIFFLKWLLLLPHLIILGVLQYVVWIIAWVGYLIVLFTGKLPDGLYKFLTGYLRWNVRAYAWGGGLTDVYPPFTFESGGYDVDLEAEPPASSSRGLALLGALFFLKALLLIPHVIVLFFLFIAWYFVVWIGYVIILFTGTLPEWAGRFQLGVSRWTARVGAWLFGITDVYPPFSLE